MQPPPPPPPAENSSETGDSQQSSTDLTQTLTADQKKSILDNLQTRLDSFDLTQMNTDASNNKTALLSTLKDELTGFDPSQATDEQISDLFDEVMETLNQSAKPAHQ